MQRYSAVIGPVMYHTSTLVDTFPKHLDQSMLAPSIPGKDIQTMRPYAGPVLFATLLSLAPALAADDSTVYTAPLVMELKPYIDVLVNAAVLAAVGFIAGLVQRYTGVQISQSALDKLRAAAATQAGILVAGAEDNLAKTTIGVGHPLVAQAADHIIALLPDAAKAVGATPEALQTLIVGEIGKLQAISTPK